ncbi:dephospho-CoA kinase [Candidatus Woesearchaeota archaeon]|nr:dephospho-CoA kinase [Candidatus Woesearchaeota archaeon]
MPKLLNITGPMAAGKSTIADILYKKLKSYAFIDRAYIKKHLQRAGKQNAKRIAKEAVHMMAKELMKLKQNILVQEMNAESLKKKLGLHMKRYGYTLHSFFLHCSVDTALKRDHMRSGKRRPGIVKRIHGYVKPTKHDVIINTEENTMEQTVNRILKEIRKKH